MKSSKTSFLRNCISGWNVRLCFYPLFWLVYRKKTLSLPLSICVCSCLLIKEAGYFLICSRAEKLKATKDKGSEAHSFTFIKQTMKQK